MEIIPAFDIDKWCIYDQKNFKLILKDNVPEEIKNKFIKWQKQFDDQYIIL